MSTRFVMTRQQVRVAALSIIVFLAILLLTGVTPERWVDNNDLKSTSWLWRLSVSAADTSVALLAAALLIGPINVLRGRRPRIHDPVRRTVGVAAGVYAVFHVSLAIFVHARASRLWSNWMELSPPEFTSGARGLANWIGLVQLAIVIGLLWLSRDAVLRRFGPKKWKLLQRSTYLLAALVAIHALLYHEVEQRIAAHATPVRITFAAIVALQLVGAVAVWRRRAT